MAHIVPYIFPVLSRRVIDGDTVETDLDLGFGLTYKGYCRISGIDTPEKNTDAGRLVKELAVNFVGDRPIYCQSFEMGKFAGRFLGELHVVFNNQMGYPFGAFLLGLGLGKPYGGAKKEPWTEAQYQAITVEAKRWISIFMSYQDDALISDHLTPAFTQMGLADQAKNIAQLSPT